MKIKSIIFYASTKPGCTKMRVVAHHRRPHRESAERCGSAARTPATVFPVGSFILDEMQERGWSIEELTRRMGGDPVTHLTLELLIHAPSKGATLDEQTARLLAAAFGTSKELWLKLDETWQQNNALCDGGTQSVESK